ncbi:hypothetical protein CRI94_00015 [Longibacter salinarum]|uniref:Uncharacterized protein n=1 Tax=Longibacter salinarum TaxID=1850348 RepID=A0A2A8D1G0_9BACT|nr:hypothetical protein [Longibacter salinarum]PEN14720.1 hypothetical protein CRI94_00015 [Longibacter salinarum]
MYLRIQRGANVYRFGAISEYVLAAIQNNFPDLIDNVGNHPIRKKLPFRHDLRKQRPSFREYGGGVHP